MKRGTATVSADELRHAIRGDAVGVTDGHVLTARASCVERGRGGSRAPGATIAFANGCFDLLHVGHVRYLQAAAARSRSPRRRDQRRRVGGGAEGAGPADPAGRAIARSSSPRCAASTTSSSSPSRRWRRCSAAAAGRALQGHRLHRRHRARARHRARLRRPHRDRRRSQGSLDPRPAGAHPRPMNILIVRLGALGDIVHAVPAAAALRAAFPDARSTGWSTRSIARSSISSPSIDRVVALERPTLARLDRRRPRAAARSPTTSRSISRD